MAETQGKPNKVVVIVVIVVTILFVLYGFYSRFLSKKETGVKSGELKPGKVVSAVYNGRTGFPLKTS